MCYLQVSDSHCTRHHTGKTQVNTGTHNVSAHGHTFHCRDPWPVCLMYSILDAKSCRQVIIMDNSCYNSNWDMKTLDNLLPFKSCIGECHYRDASTCLMQRGLISHNPLTQFCNRCCYQMIDLCEHVHPVK